MDYKPGVGRAVQHFWTVRSTQQKDQGSATGVKGERYALFCERLVRERFYDSACLLMSNETDGLQGGFSEPSEEIAFKFFATSLTAHAAAFAEMEN